MKKLMTTALFLVAITSVFAQKQGGFGLKGGVNYNANGDYYDSATNTYESPESVIGYHLGVFAKIGDQLYFRPELMYSKTESEYTSGNFELQKLDAPLLVGLNITGPLQVFAGPSLQYIIDSDFENATIGSFKDDFTVGLNLGIGLSFDKIGIDLRYERGFNDNEASVINDNITIDSSRLDARADQLILSLSILL
ncbi:porin family protein [Bizionia paragorgiae]|uniref:Outer membrane protein beta-barrel domain-containing protein n=1 Tax=Bizionia paragorgiae TaxID=283786 RepID=A0A1H4D9J5_BIZPA|nr:porin family protein [Bizionia paragorgiae]SEA69435.1 Outer membrane protein beta-barrel domain-containing protein [Bizionia paragorgiae]